MKFWLLWGIDALVALGFVFFFVVGLQDGTVSSFNIVLWLTILGGLAAILGGSYFLKAKGHALLATCLLCVVALPSLAGLSILLLVLIAHPRMN